MLLRRGRGGLIRIKGGEWKGLDGSGDTMVEKCVPKVRLGFVTKFM